MGDRKMKSKKIAIGLIVAATVVFGAVCAWLLPSSDRIADGLHIGNTAVGGMTQEEAKQELTKVCQQIGKNGTVLELKENEDKTWSVKASEIDFVVDVDKTVERAYAVGREGNLFACIADAYQARSDHDMVGYAVQYNEEKLKAFIDGIRAQVEVKPLEARAEVVGGKVVIHPHQTGYLVDANAVLADVRNAGSQLPYQVSLHTQTVHTQVTEESLADIKDVLGIYTTRFSTAAVGRTENIRLSAKSINGKLMKPNDVFSFNDVVGYRSAERGYQEAPVIVKGKMEPGIGGGICQVSTTLFNAVLLADLGIVERRNHSFPSSYVPIGLDATVDYGSKDLRFRNTRQSDIYLWLRVEGNRVTAAVLGNKSKEPVPSLKFFSEVVEVIPMEVEKIEDMTVPAGTEVVEEKGKDGYLTATYRVRNGQKQLLHRDKYIAKKRVVRFNPNSAVAVTAKSEAQSTAVESKPAQQTSAANVMPPKPTESESSALPPRPAVE